MTERFAASDLTAFAEALFTKAGMDADKATVIAPIMVEGDLMGHTTHGLQLAAPYLGDLTGGQMRGSGEPEIVSDRGAVATWDGRRLPGVWLTAQAVDQSVDRARTYGTATVAIRRAHHIACLAAYLERATSRGMMIMLTCSDPWTRSVAPFGGTTPAMTPNPIAFGYPTGGDPVLVDISASITTNGMSGRLKNEGRRLPGQWVQDASGNPTDDPAVLFTDPPGSILPIGGKEYGHKGFGLGLTIEALTQGLSGHGRADPPEGWGANVFVQVYDPTAFAGSDAFIRQTGWLADACRADRPAPGADKVRLPGDGALARKRRALADGVALHPSIMPALAEWAGRLGVAVPKPV